MKNEFEDVPPQIIILNEEETSPKENNMLKSPQIKWNKLTGYIIKHYKILSIIAIALIGVFLSVRFWIYGSSRVTVNESGNYNIYINIYMNINNTHIEESNGVIIDSPGSTTTINK